MKFYKMRKVLKNDWKRILTNPVALLVILGIACIPGLYAWVNIAACWDVYENTGGIPVAIVNNDKPAKLGDREIFIGESVVEQLKENKQMDWKFVSERQADLGLADGTYFAAIELPEDFSSNFATLLSETPTKPKIIFKVDNKVNPVAGKITESAKNALVQEIKSSFVSTVNQSLFTYLNPVGKDAEANLQSIIQMKEAIVKLNQNMDLISTTLDNLHTNSINLNQFLTSFNATWPLVQSGLEVLGKSAVNQQELSRATQQRLDESLNYLDTNLSYIQNSSERTHALLTELNEAAKAGSTASLDSAFLNLDITLSAMSSAVDATASYLEEYKEIDWSADAKYAEDQLKLLRNDLVNLRNQLSELQNNLHKLDPEQLKQNIQTTYNALNLVAGSLGTMADILETLPLPPSPNPDDPQSPEAMMKELVKSLKDLQQAVQSLSDALDLLLKNWDDVVAALETLDQTITNVIQLIDNTLPKIDKTIEFLQMVQANTSDKKYQLTQMINSLKTIQAEIDSMRTKLSDVHQQADAAAQISAGIVDTLNNDLYQTENQLTGILKEYHQSIRGDVSTIGSRLVNYADNTATLAQSAQKLGIEIGKMLNTAKSGVGLTADMTGTLGKKLEEFESTIKVLGDRLELANNNDIVQIISILQSNPEFMGDFIAKPFDQKVESIYTIPNYGSGMAPTYTALALWVGCLFMNSVLKSRPAAFEGAEFMSAHEKHYGKMMTFCSIALLQGLIVSLGDILLLKVYTVSPGLFILFAVFSSLVFCIITYTLYSCFGNAGKVFAIIYLIFQIPGSGGTYPIQVNPPIFKILQPLFPFTYTVSGFREAIAGPSTSQVLLDFATLAIFALIFLIAGYFILEKTEESVHRFAESFKESGLSE